MLFDGLTAKRRIEPEEPSRGLMNQGLFTFRPPVAGVSITEQTALTYSAVWACVRIISETIAMLPWRVLEQQGSSKVLNPAHPVDMVLHRRPNDEMTPMTFRETVLGHAVSWGNGYAEIERTKGGEVYALWPITPERVNPDRTQNGTLYYDVCSAGGGGNVAVRAAEMFHVKGLGFDGTVGYSVVHMAREAISAGLATEQFGSSLFGNGALPSGVIEQEKGVGESLSEEAVKNMLKSFNKRNRGARNANRVEYLDAGMKFNPITIKPEEAQFLETREFQVREICRWFRMQPHKLADLDRATHTNIESQNIEHVVDTIMPWAVRLEQELNMKCFPRGDYKNYSKINLAALLRGDSKARGEFYKLMLDHGVYDIDEVRGLEDLNELPNGAGKLRLVPMNMVSIDQAANGQASKVTREQRQVVREAAQRMASLECNRTSKAIEKSEKEPAAIAQAYHNFAPQLAEALVPIIALMDPDASEPNSIAVDIATAWVKNAQLALRESSDQVDLVQAWRLNRAEALYQFILARTATQEENEDV
jgi:HK97 family phage portal protein